MGTDAGADVMNGYPDYAAASGRTWTLQVGDGTATEVVLSLVVPHRSAWSTGFTLTFLHPASADHDLHLAQGTYLLSGAGVPPSPVFLVPVAQTPAGTELQAVFNHLVADREAAS